MDSAKIAVDVAEAASQVSISRAKFYQLVMAGEVPSFKVGSRRLVPLSSLRAWAEEQAASGGPA